MKTDKAQHIFFFDDDEVTAKSGCSLRPVEITRHGKIMEAEGPWEWDFISVFAGTVMTLPGGGYRMYYYTHKSGSTHQKSRMRIALAESADGFHWSRPLLGQRSSPGEENNHLLIKGIDPELNITQPSVVALPGGGYRMYCWLHNLEEGCFRYIISESGDGISWETLGVDRPAIIHPADCEVGQMDISAGLAEAVPGSPFAGVRKMPFFKAKQMRSNDATHVYYREAEGKFEMFTIWLLPGNDENGRKTPQDNAPKVLRVIHRRESLDGIEWSDPELVVLPDAADPLDQQFYYLSAYYHQQWRIGFLGNYPCQEQTMDIELCFSRDGKQWKRPLREPFIPRPEIPEDGCLSAYAANTLLPVAGNQRLLLYSAGNTYHNHRMPPGVDAPRRDIRGVSIPEGRFAGLSSQGRAPARILLKPRIQSAKEITVNGDFQGTLRGELRDPVGTRLEGFELYNSNPVHGDSSRHVLTWGPDGNTSAVYRYDALVLYLEWDAGTLYSVEY